MVLSHGALVNLCRNHTIVGVDEENIGPASIDLTLDDKFLIPALCQSKIGRPAHGIGPDMIEHNGSITLAPGQICLVSTNESVRFHSGLCAHLFTRSTVGRCFVNHMLAGWIDPGFHGRITLEFKNDSPIPVMLCKGDRLIQMVVQDCDPSDKPYSGKYQFDTCVSEAKYDGR